MNLLWLLLGPGNLRQGRWALTLLGGLLLLLGLLFFLDSLGMVTELALEAFGYILVVLGLFRTAFAIVGTGSGMPVRFAAQGLALMLLGIGVADFPDTSNQAVPWMFGVAFLVNGIYQFLTALVIRYPRWGWFLVSGLVHIGLAMGMFLFWRQVMPMVIPVLLGGGLFVLGLTALRLAMRLRNFNQVPGEMGPEDRLRYFMTFHLPHRFQRADYALPELPATLGTPHGDLLVHLWSPTDVARLDNPDPSIMRYIMAQDGDGKITVGHAAMEMTPDVYMSHCDGDPGGYEDSSEAWRELRSKDGHGVFLPSFEEEIEHYLQPSLTLRFRNFSEEQVRTFWHMYRQITIYNLTNRNCSVVVALALEAAIMGSMAGTSRSRSMFRLLLSRDLWVAHFLRWKAIEMVWTPSMMRDYALVLHRLVEA